MGDLWKNFILVFLIILIIHYIIKNHLLQQEIIAGLEKKPVTPQPTFPIPVPEKSIAIKGLREHQSMDVVYKNIDQNVIEKMDQELKTKLETRAKDMETPIASNDIVGTRLNDTAKSSTHCMKDLYDFVFNEDQSQPVVNVHNYGQQITNQPLDKNMRSTCDISDVFTKTKAVCDVGTEINNIFKNNEKPRVAMDSVEGNQHFTIVNKYKTEPIMNGGSLLNIQGYDCLEPEYSLL